MSLARTAGPYYGSIDGASLQTAVNTIAGPSGGEIILLHGDKRRLRLMVNLIAQLNAWRIDHILVLGFTSETCDTLRAGKRIGCASLQRTERIRTSSTSLRRVASSAST